MLRDRSRVPSIAHVECAFEDCLERDAERAPHPAPPYRGSRGSASGDGSSRSGGRRLRTRGTYGPQPSRTSFPSYVSGSTSFASSNPRPGSTAYTTESTASKDPQPRVLAPDAPTGLVRRDHRRARKGADDLAMRGLEAIGGAEDRLGKAAPTHVDPEDGTQERLGLPERQPQFLLKVCRKRLRPRSELARRGPQCVRRLLGMAALNAPSAVLAVADVNIELGDFRFYRRDLGLVLLIDPVLDHAATTVGAARRKARRREYRRFCRGSFAAPSDHSSRRPFRPGFFGFFFGDPLEKGLACRLPDRRARSRASRSFAFSSRRAASSSRSAAISFTRSSRLALPRGNYPV